MATISIVVPSYNHAQFSSACAESVLAQTFTDWEMAVVDDCSSDDSFEQWSAVGDPRIRVVRNESNSGTYSSLNRAVEMTTGRWIAVLNSDDWWHPEKLARQVEALNRNPDAVCCATAGCRENEGGQSEESDVHRDWPRTERFEALPWLLAYNRILASSVVFRRDFARFDGNLRYCGDWLALLQAGHAAPIVWVDDPLCHWRIHAGNAHQIHRGVTREETSFRRWLASATRSLLPPRLSGLDRAVARRCAGKNCLHLSALCLLWNNPRAARRAAFQAVRFTNGAPAAVKRWAACLVVPARARKHMWPAAGDDYPWEEVTSLPAPAWRTRSDGP